MRIEPWSSVWKTYSMWLLHHWPTVYYSNCSSYLDTFAKYYSLIYNTILTYGWLPAYGGELFVTRLSAKSYKDTETSDKHHRCIKNKAYRSFTSYVLSIVRLDLKMKEVVAIYAGRLLRENHIRCRSYGHLRYT